MDPTCREIVDGADDTLLKEATDSCCETPFAVAEMQCFCFETASAQRAMATIDRVAKDMEVVWPSSRSVADIHLSVPQEMTQRAMPFNGGQRSAVLCIA